MSQEPTDHLRGDISREEINRLDLREYPGPVQIITADAQIENALNLLRGETLLGFDTETRPAFRKGQSYLPSVLQLATRDCVLIFQLSRLGLPAALTPVLTDPAVIKAGVAVRDDIKALQMLVPFEPHGFVDLGNLARRAGLKTNGLRNLAANLLGFRVSKRAQCTNWGSPALSARQIRYAATDAWVSRSLFLRLDELGLIAPDLDNAPREQ